MIELVRFRGKAEIINIFPRRSAQTTSKLVFSFWKMRPGQGSRALNIVKSIEHRYREDSEQIITEILEQWINGNDKQPVTWGTLI